VFFRGRLQDLVQQLPDDLVTHRAMTASG
jgi:hypothetical protein